MASHGDNITFSSLGIGGTNDIATVRFLGKIRKWWSLAAYEKWLIMLSNVSLLVILAFTIYVIARSTGTDVTFAFLIIFNLAVSFLYTWKGVLQESPSVMIVLVISALVLVAYVVGNFAAISYASSSFDQKWKVKLARLVLLLAAAPPIVILAVKAAHRYCTSKRLIFRTVGASLHLQNACQNLHIAQSLLLFDFQSAASLIIVEFNNENVCTICYSQYKTVLVAVGIPFSLVWLILGYATMPRENSLLMYVFWGLSVFSPAFLVYRVYSIISDWHGSGAEDYSNFLDIASLICAAVGIVMRVLVIVWTVKVYRNFGKGLKTQVCVHDDAQPIIRDH